MKINSNKILKLILLIIILIGIVIFFFKKTENKTLYPSGFSDGNNIQVFENNLDNNGIPIIIDSYTNKTTYHPSRICRYELYLTAKYFYEKSETNYLKIKNIANWIIKNKINKKKFITWELHENNDSFNVYTPWTSALTNAWCAGALLQASSILQNHSMEKDAKLALNYLFIPVEDGGGLSRWDDGDIWFEEVPSIKNPSHILNGFIYSIDILDMFCNYYDNEQYNKYYKLAISSLKNKVHLYDLDYGSIYDQFTKGNKLGMSYHKIHYRQLYWMYLRTKDEYFYNLSQKWFALQVQSKYKIQSNDKKNLNINFLNNSIYWTDYSLLKTPFEIFINFDTETLIKTINIYSVNEIFQTNIFDFYYLDNENYKIIDSNMIDIKQKGYNLTLNNKTTYVYVVYFKSPIKSSSIQIKTNHLLSQKNISLREIGVNKDSIKEFENEMSKLSHMNMLSKIYEE